MTKEQLYVKWLMTPDLKSDIESVIANEIAKAQEVKPKPDYICYKCENKTFNKFAICDICNTGWNEPEQQAKPQPDFNPIEQAYHAFQPIRWILWNEGWNIKKHSDTESIDRNGKIYDNKSIVFNFDTSPEEWELYTEPTDQVTDQVTDHEKSVETEKPSSQVKLDNSFDKDRFERMFCAVVASGGSDVLATVNKALAQLDAYYATKEGGNNG